MLITKCKTANNLIVSLLSTKMKLIVLDLQIQCDRICILNRSEANFVLNENSLRVKLMRKIGATRMITLSFIFVILLGAILLTLPFSNNLDPLSFLDNLFISTSATCVTGLVPANIMEQYNYFGYSILLVLIQIGGLGVMSLIAFVITVTKHKLYHSEKRMLQNALNKDSLQDIPKFLRSIIIYTFVFETIGALLIMTKFIPIFGISKGIYNSIFLSVSAFCNAGIDNFSLFSLAEYSSDVLINATVASLIIIGGLGFAVWFDLRKRFIERLNGKYSLKKMFSLLNLHSKVVLITTLCLIVSGTVLMLITESFNSETLGSMSTFDKIQAAIFQSITLRTAGFSTIDIGLLQDTTLMFMCLYMFIGGSPGGTAGGIKTTAFVMMVMFVRSQLVGNDKLTAFKRTIPMQVFHKAFMVGLLYVILIFVSLFLLTISEDIAFLPLLFEVVSAIGTVGLSASVTPLLSDFGKIVIMILMFAGRVGPITIILSMVKKKSKNKSHEVEYPTSEILIG